MSWLDPARRALDDRTGSCAVFFRDDDVGRGDDRLSTLLSRFADHGVVVDLAVIPALVTLPLADDLTRRLEADEIRVHQHGLAHLNHETVGRAHEFGPSRSLEQQVTDVRRGRALMAAWFGADAVDPVFTPPWNRCTPDTARALRHVGLPVLSRDRTARPLSVPGLTEVPVTLDWFGHHKGVRWTLEELGSRLADQLRGTTPVGVMLHHAVTDPAEHIHVDELIALLAGHPAVRLSTLAELASPEVPSEVAR